MPAHILDSRFLQDLYGTPEMRAVFDDMRLLQKWLDVEVALAQAEAEIGMIPEDAAAEISRCAQASALDTIRIKELVDQTVHPIVPVIRVLKEACAGEAGEYIHWGATTQDIMDTALVLQLKDTVDIIENRLDKLDSSMKELARAHRDTLIAGRTHGQQAVPITFGFKVAVWIAEVERHRERLAECKPRLLVGQLGGAAGTLASLDGQGLEIQRRMMEKLGLGVPPIAWHTARDGFAEFAALLGMVSATCGKIAREVINLQRTELGEVEEPFIEGKVGSSTMPHKHNPMLCEAILALARLALRLVPLGMDAMIQEHERDWSGDHLEWAYLPEICIMADGALHLASRVVSGLQVHPRRMQDNLDRHGGFMLSEAIMLALAKRVGRQRAHEIVYKCALRARELGIPFRQVLAEQQDVTQHLSPEEMDRLLNPERYTGLAGEFVDRVLAGAARRSP